MPRRCALAPLAITHLNVLFPRPPPPSSSTARRPRPANHPLDGPRVVLLHLRRRAARHPPPLPLPPLMLLLAPSPLFRSFSRRPLSFSYPLLSFRSLRHRERGGHDTCQSTADARIDTDGPRLLSFTLSISLSFSTLSPPPLPSSYCRQLPSPRHPPQPTSPSPFITSPVTAAHPATNLLRMLALYARLALNV